MTAALTIIAPPTGGRLHAIPYDSHAIYYADEHDRIWTLEVTQPTGARVLHERVAGKRLAGERPVMRSHESPGAATLIADVEWAFGVVRDELGVTFEVAAAAATYAAAVRVLHPDGETPDYTISMTRPTPQGRPYSVIEVHDWRRGETPEYLVDHYATLVEAVSAADDLKRRLWRERPTTGDGIRYEVRDLDQVITPQYPSPRLSHTRA